MIAYSSPSKCTICGQPSFTEDMLCAYRSQKGSSTGVVLLLDRQVCEL